MATGTDPFRRSAMMQSALRRVGSVTVAVLVLWLCILWSISLA